MKENHILCLVTKMTVKPFEDLNKIKNKFKYIKEKNISVDWENDEFCELWGNPYLEKVSSSEEQINTLEIITQVDMGIKHKLNDYEFNHFIRDYKIFGNETLDDIEDRIDLTRKMKIWEKS